MLVINYYTLDTLQTFDEYVVHVSEERFYSLGAMFCCQILSQLLH